jgi:hypothetical protein
MQPFVEVSWMANAFLEALSGSDCAAQGSCAGPENLVHMEKVRPVSAGPGSSKIIFLGENYKTVCRPFMVRSRSRQPTLSICNLSGLVATLVTTECGVTCSA